MTKTNRRHFSPEQKLAIVLESFQKDTTIESVKRRHGLIGSVIHRWREEFKTRAPEIFADKRGVSLNKKKQNYDPSQSPDELKKIIGELTV
ncbi:MAG: transposase, partial [bacterium]